MGKVRQVLNKNISQNLELQSEKKTMYKINFKSILLLLKNNF